MKSVRIRSYSGPLSVQMQENASQNNSKYRHFLHIVNEQDDKTL